MGQKERKQIKSSKSHKNPGTGKQESVKLIAHLLKKCQNIFSVAKEELAKLIADYASLLLLFFYFYVYVFSLFSFFYFLCIPLLSFAFLCLPFFHLPSFLFFLFIF